MCASGSVLTVRETAEGNQVRIEKHSNGFILYLLKNDFVWNKNRCTWKTDTRLSLAAVHGHTARRRSPAERWKSIMMPSNINTADVTGGNFLGCVGCSYKQRILSRSHTLC